MTKSRLTLAFLAGVVLACAGDAEQPVSSVEPFVDSVAFAEAFEVLRVVMLEETDEVVTVTPRVIPDHMGDLIVTDALEAQIRLYGRDGTLKNVLGRSGAGPGEFRAPTSARRTVDGQIVVPDPMLSRITFFEADSVTATAPSPIQLLLDVFDLGDDRLLLSGVDNPSNNPPHFLHIWNRQTEEIEHSFFPMIVSDAMRTLASTFLASTATLVGDTVWAAWTISDTVYKYNRDGDELAKIPIPLPRPTKNTMPEPDRVMDVTEIGSSLNSITQVSSIHPATGGRLVVQAGQMRGMRLYEWDLVIMDQRGHPELQMIGTPRLLLVDDDEFWFMNPNPLLANQILVTRRRKTE